MTALKDNPLFAEAFRLMIAGFSVIPCRADKTPLLGAGEIFAFRNVPADEVQITKWWTDYPDANVGIITGKVSGITVIDIDSYKPGSVDPSVFPETFTVKTGQGGLQLYYKYEEGFTISANGYLEFPNMDLRSDGGYVIAPPSVTSFIKNGKKVGGRYEVLKNIAFAPFPIHLFPQKKKTRKLESQIGVSAGSRNDSIASFIGRVLRTAKESEWETEVWPAVKIANATYLPPLEERELRTTFDSIAKKERDSREGKTQEYLPAISFAELMAADFSNIRYTVDPFFEQNTLNMITAPPNNWKSWIIFLLAYNIAVGKSFLDKFKVEKTSVMIVNEEDSLMLAQQRFLLLGIKEPELPVYFRVARGAQLDVKLVENLIAEAKVKNVGVIMFDSLRSLHGANENDSQEMQVVLNLLKKITREGITVIFTHHHRKKSLFAKQDEAEAARGSSAISAALSGHLSLEETTKDNEKFLIIRHLKSKTKEKMEPFEIKITKDNNNNGDVTGIGFSYAGEFKAAEQKLSETKQKILGILTPDKWITVKALYAVSAGGLSFIRKSLAQLKQEGVVVCQTRGELTSKGIKVEEGKNNERFYSVVSSADQKENEENQDDFDF